MYLLANDCVMFKASSHFNIDDSLHSTLPYEALNVTCNKSNYIGFTFRWSDPIRFRKKIIERNQLSLKLLYFKQSQIMVCFGSSESIMGFGIKRIKDILQIKLKKINLFETYEHYIKCELVSADFITESSCNESEIKKTNTSKISKRILKRYFKENVIVSLTFKAELDQKVLSYFYVDKGSVISFPDMLKEEVIYEVFNKAFKNI